MKTIIAGLSLVCAALSAAQEADWTAWQWEAPVEIGKSGMVRLEVPPMLLDVSRPDLGDLRVLSAGAAETPYLVEEPVRRTGGVRDAAEFKVVLSGRSTVIEVTSGSAGLIEAVQLVTPARDFLKAVNIDGRTSGGEWRKLAENEVIFRQSGDVERLRIPIAAGVWEGFRLTVDDERTPPVPFTGVRVVLSAEKPPTTELPLVLGERKEAGGETRLALDLGAANLHVAELRFVIADAVFSRACTLGFETAAPDGKTRMETFGAGVLYRVAGDRGTSAEELVIPVHRRIPNRHVIAVFRNGDSPPLTIRSGGVRCDPTVLAFHAAQAGRWRMITGNPGAETPGYDLNPLRGVLVKAGGQGIQPGPPRAKPVYRKPPALPGVEPAGAGIDLAGWSRRCPVESVTTGVIRIELDARALAGCRADLGDLRLIQNGRQIPYRLEVGPERLAGCRSTSGGSRRRGASQTGLQGETRVGRRIPLAVAGAGRRGGGPARDRGPVAAASAGGLTAGALLRNDQRARRGFLKQSVAAGEVVFNEKPYRDRQKEREDLCDPVVRQVQFHGMACRRRRCRRFFRGIVFQ